eukprot:11897202-Alexandrium_andersonii.AAC.1
MSAPPTKGESRGPSAPSCFGKIFEDRGRGTQGCAIAAVLVGGPHDPGCERPALARAIMALALFWCWRRNRSSRARRCPPLLSG